MEDLVWSRLRPGFAARPLYRPIYGGAYRPWRGAYYPGVYRRAYYGSALWGGYGYPYGYGYGYGYPYYGGYYDNGGAVVAGLIGGLALGAIANAATHPVYRTAGDCFYERRQVGHEKRAYGRAAGA